MVLGGLGRWWVVILDNRAILATMRWLLTINLSLEHFSLFLLMYFSWAWFLGSYLHIVILHETIYCISNVAFTMFLFFSCNYLFVWLKMISQPAYNHQLYFCHILRGYLVTQKFLECVRDNCIKNFEMKSTNKVYHSWKLLKLMGMFNRPKKEYKFINCQNGLETNCRSADF